MHSKIEVSPPKTIFQAMVFLIIQHNTKWRDVTQVNKTVEKTNIDKMWRRLAIYLFEHLWIIL